MVSAEFETHAGTSMSNFLSDKIVDIEETAPVLREILKFFDTLGLRQKLTVSTENLMFLEFIYLLCRVFDIDATCIQEYFDV